ncbi:MAG: endopeptidase La [Alphaproteobacteria bacterium]|nr:endopeptidase La [Alphaproteobacteria bacterium]
MNQNIKLVSSTAAPTLPLRDVVVFPDMIFPLFVGREKSLKSLNIAMKGNKKIFLVSQKSPDIDSVKKEDLYNVGVLGDVIQMIKLPDGTIKLLVETKSRAKLVNFYDKNGCFTADIDFLEDITNNKTEIEGASRALKEKFRDYIAYEDRIPADLVAAILELDNPSKLADHIASSLPVKIEKKQESLAELDVELRLRNVLSTIKGELQIIETENKLKTRIKTQLESSQKEYYLNEQLKAIKKELGEATEEAEDDLEVFAKLIKEKKLSKEANAKAKSELKKLKAMNPLSSEAGIVRGYLEWLLNIPWKDSTKLKIDIAKSEQVLDEEHYGLEKVKERILEFIAVNKRVKLLKGPILCLVGPPGVGKTSLARSIARSMGREFAKVSLGGVRDEAEIRGHRRTYIGAMPGKIIQQLKKSGSSNPLFLLDEIDKMGQDFRGDPASALLEVLDPEQNSNFSDHYLEIDYDLSEIMFVTTANSLDLPHALRDRMEIINLSGYIENDKLEIAKRHLLPKQISLHGLAENEIKISDSAIISLVRRYTYEAGVRNLERELANLARKVTKKIDASSKINSVAITAKNLEKYAGVPKFDFGKVEDIDLIGVTTGLAYTEFGGDILALEAVKIPGDGKIICTGKLGDVMKESIQAAFSYFKSRAHEFGISEEEYKKYDIHIHVPEGATPKDGPSAGVGIYTSIVSILTSIAVDRLVAMTGEITLRGRVLPIGGLKEKLLAALRSGIKKVIIPEKNKKDLTEISKDIKSGLEIYFASNLDDVIKIALVKWPKPDRGVNISKEDGSSSVNASTH